VNFVLDTNAVSEAEKPRPNSGFIEWHDRQDAAHLFITSMTIAEVWHGFHRLKRSHPDYESIRRFAEGLAGNYRVLNFDARAATIWGQITAQTDGPLPLRDSIIAAIALSRGFRFVTRDTSPFERMNCNVLNPWK
jgi:predicted nucleic acid-binding protein